jgi:hypothetical protein
MMNDIAKMVTIFSVFKKQATVIGSKYIEFCNIELLYS